MRFSLFKLTTVLAAASSAVMAQTPPRFEPSTKNNLQVKFGSIDIIPGKVEPQKDLESPPALAVQSTGAPMYIAFMMDISVVLKPGSTPTTLVHWVRPYLWVESDGSLKSTTMAALAPYMPPGPPPGQTHNYVVLLFQQPPDFKVPETYKSYFANITASVNNRIGFNLSEFTEATGLKRVPVAANWFRVSTPARPSTSASSGSAATSSPSRDQATVPTSSASMVQAVNSMTGLVGLVICLIGFGNY